MFLVRYRTLLVLLAGLLFGGLAGYGVKASRAIAVALETEVPEMDMAQFAEAGTMDAGVALARQLAVADAEKCAALARAMLAKRVKVPYSDDPFLDESLRSAREEYLPERAWEGLFKRWMKAAPQAAWEFVMAHHSDELPLRVAALRQWALLDPEAAVKAAGSELIDREKTVILRACVVSDPAMGLKLLAEWGLEFGDSDDRDFYDSTGEPTLVEKLLMRYAEKAPSAALDWCIMHAPALRDSVCVGWMRHDADACMLWVQARPVDEQKLLMSTICDQADVTASSVRYLASLCEPGNRWHWINKGLLSLAQRDDALAQTLIDELLSNPSDRLVFRSEIANVIAETNPRKALEFILPALRQALPLFERQSDIFVDLQLPSSVGFSGDPFASSYSGLTSVIRSYIELGPAAGVGKNEVLDLLGQIHSQYHACLLEESLSELQNVLGPPVEWIQPYTKKMSRDQLRSLVDEFDYTSPDQARQAVISLQPGPLRDVLAERYMAILLENNVPVATVLDRAREFGADTLDMGSVYGNWVEKEPAAALQHFADDPHPSANEWRSVIESGYETHSSEIQDMVEKLPSGDIRNAAAKTLADTAMTQGNDFVTSMYWATEITIRMERVKKMREVFEAWGENESAMYDAAIRDRMLANIENSALDAKEKALWLERMESEVSR